MSFESFVVLFGVSSPPRYSLQARLLPWPPPPDAIHVSSNFNLKQYCWCLSSLHNALLLQQRTNPTSPHHQLLIAAIADQSLHTSHRCHPSLLRLPLPPHQASTASQDFTISKDRHFSLA
ncbi:hypothetical protein IHE45_03G043100 [Dioscorea alata]|uniref:Uncharacterized protein n=1 Tax=Dioscorea alata TaxID=55571 RepID=A0ACB7WKU1_DIOAL|nr:hypothetical protein IHE45_03G043100 [Dioscorea alata]